jgi:4-aminobutyrate aminotransferase-like enzyme
MTENQLLLTRKNTAISRGVGMMTQVYAARAENAEIWDVEGHRYIDFAAGIAVVNTGHRHPKVIEAVKAQLDAFTHTCHQVVPYGNYVHLAERLPMSLQRQSRSQRRSESSLSRLACATALLETGCWNHTSAKDPVCF